MSELEAYIRTHKPSGPFKAIPIVQDVDGETYVTVCFKDVAFYGDPINEHITLYRAFDTKEVIGCAFFLPKD